MIGLKEKLFRSKAESVVFALLLLSGIASCILFLQPVRGLVIRLTEDVLLGRKLNNIPYWNAVLMRMPLVWQAVWLSIFFFFRNKKYFVFSFAPNISDDNQPINPIQKATTQNILFLALCVCSSLAVLVLAFLSKDIWYDEAFSLALVRHGFFEIAELTALDVHPPVYYFLLKFANLLCPDSVTAAKIVSVIPSIVIIFLTGFFLKKHYGVKSATFFVLFFIASSPILNYSIEIRMYSWAALFCTVCAILSWRMIFKGGWKDFLLYGIFAALAALTQHFATVAIFIYTLLLFAYLLYLDKANFKKVLATCAVGILLYAPELPVVLRQFGEVSESYWIDPITFRNLAEYGTTLFSCGNSLFALAVMFFALYCFINLGINFVSCIKKKEKSGQTKNTAFLLLIFMTSPLLILTGVLVSLAVRPVFVSRYIVPVIPFMLICLSVCLSRNSCKSYSKFLCAILSVCALLCISSRYLDEIQRNILYKEFKTELENRVTTETQFVYPLGETTHFRGILSYLYPGSTHFLPARVNFASRVFESDWRDLREESPDSEKPICLVIDTNADDYEERKANAGFEFPSDAEATILTPGQYGEITFLWLNPIQ